MKVLGIDPGTNVAGWAIVEDGVVIAHGKIHPSPKMDEQDKIILIYNTIYAVIDTYTPDMVGCEDQFCGPNPKTLKILSRLVGAILLACEQHDLKAKLMAPTHVKSVFTGKGKASKEEMVEKASTMVSDTLCNDEADAIAVAITLIEDSKIVEVVKNVKPRKRKI